jgi:transposase
MSVLVHAETHGMASAIDAFSISRSTFYNWRKAFKQGGNKMAALAPLSTRPVHLRTSAPRPWHKAQILALRQKYYGMGRYSWMNCVKMPDNHY